MRQKSSDPHYPTISFYSGTDLEGFKDIALTIVRAYPYNRSFFIIPEKPAVEIPAGFVTKTIEHLEKSSITVVSCVKSIARENSFHLQVKMKPESVRQKRMEEITSFFTKKFLSAFIDTPWNTCWKICPVSEYPMDEGPIEEMGRMLDKSIKTCLETPPGYYYTIVKSDADYYVDERHTIVVGDDKQ